MSLTATLQALTAPQGTEIPGSLQDLLNLFAQYESIVGLDSFNGINYGPTTPDEDSRGYPWFQTDNAYNPIAWNAWNGSAWTPIPMTVPSGATAARPNPASNGMLFLDTTINCTLIYERSQWRTLAGSPGDVKEVKAADLTTALANNPGWEYDSDSDGCVVANVISSGTGTGAHMGDTAGNDQIDLIHDNLPLFRLPLQSGWDLFNGHHQNGNQEPAVFPVVSGQATTNYTADLVYDDPNTGQVPIDMRQKTIYYFRLLKQ